MKHVIAVISLVLIFILHSGSIAIAQDSSGHSGMTGHTAKKANQHDHDIMKLTSKTGFVQQHEKPLSTAAAASADTDKTSAAARATGTTSVRRIMEAYLQLKDALVGDKTDESATAGTALEAAFIKFDSKALTAAQKKAYAGIADDAREHAEHIGKNGGNIEHQREHFDMLSNDMYDLVKAFGTEQLLYKDFCPMYNSKKGAIWLSDKKEIKNPYYGKKMLTCGSVKEEIK